MHFLKKLVETPQLEDPAKNYFFVHRHFYRYSKGEFIGPAIKITKTKAKITIKGTHEYEDLIQEITCKASSTDEFIISGNLETGKDLTEELYATEKLYEFVEQGIPFREAYKIIAQQY